MTSPAATDVCKRFWLSPLPYLSIVVIILGAMGAIVTLAIGYYMVYRSEFRLGLCFASDHPGIRRACILDLGGGVMSMSLGVLLLFIEFASAYINRKDWKITFFVIKIIIAVITTIVLVAGTIQGAASYAEYCDQDVYFKRCNGNNQHDPDVDFLTIVIVTGIGALSWVILLGAEIFRLCLVLIGVDVTQGCLQGINTTDHELQRLQTASHDFVTN